MSTALAIPDNNAIEQALIGGDLSKLNPQQRTSYYNQVCNSLGLNPLTGPFSYIVLNGKLTLYAKRDCAEQLRKVNGVSITSLEKTFKDDLYIVTANAQDKTGRMDSSTGAVSILGLKGENLANALMKAETKAKRRVTLSICGLGILDETEVTSIPGATLPPALEEQGLLAQKKPADVVELSGIVLSEKATEEFIWYELQALTNNGEEKIFVKSVKSTDDGRLADKIGHGVTLEVQPTGKKAKDLKSGVWLLYDIVKIGKHFAAPVNEDDPQTITGEDEKLLEYAPAEVEPIDQPKAKSPDTAPYQRIGKGDEIKIHTAQRERGMPSETYHKLLGKYGYEHAKEVQKGDFKNIIREIGEYVG